MLDGQRVAWPDAEEPCLPGVDLKRIVGPAIISAYMPWLERVDSQHLALLAKKKYIDRELHMKPMHLLARPDQQPRLRIELLGREQPHHSPPEAAGSPDIGPYEPAPLVNFH